MSERSDLEAQKGSAKAKLESEKAQLNKVNAQIAEVQAAKTEIEELKQRADDQRTVLKNLDCEDEYYWKGSQRDLCIDDYNNGKTDAKNFYNGLDDLADDLVWKENTLLSARDILNGNINWLENALRSIRSALDALVN